MADASGAGRARPALGPAEAPERSIAARAPGARDPRLDVFRGLALAMIYINHVPGTLFEHLTSRNFGFSDAAEGFVIMSGIAAGIAYSPDFTDGRAWRGLRRVWGRAWTLYMVHIVTTMMAIGIMAAAARGFGLHRMIETNNMAAFFDDQIGVLIGLPTLGHQLGYFNILPLYMVLLLATPGMILIARSRPLALLGMSVALWVAAGAFRLNLPAYPNPGGWFFNPLSWQLIFVVGLLTGMALRRGERFVPVDARLVWASAVFLVVVLVWQLVPPVAEVGRAVVVAGRDAGLPFYVAGFDKTFVAVPRGLHALALVYLLSALPQVRSAVGAAWARPLALMGRQGLPVFATGSVLAILGQSIRAAAPESHVFDAWIIISGLLIQLAVAWTFETLSAKRVRAAGSAQPG